jgi:hypothetical protein
LHPSKRSDVLDDGDFKKHKCKYCSIGYGFERSLRLAGILPQSIFKRLSDGLSLPDEDEATSKVNAENNANAIADEVERGRMSLLGSTLSAAKRQAIPDWAASHEERGLKTLCPASSGCDTTPAGYAPSRY